jgi:phosphatidylinositol alpha-1,6-mannosyltransferase
MMLTRNFPPLLGGMERLNLRMSEAIAARVPLVLLGPRGASAHSTPEAQVVELSASPLWRFGIGLLMSVLMRVRAVGPRAVLAGSGVVSPFALLAARLAGAPCVVYLHGLDLVTPNLIYRAIWLPSIRACDLAFANSEHTRSLAIERGLHPERVHVLHPGVDMPVLSRTERLAAGISWKSVMGLDGRRVLLSVGRLTRRKGLAEFIAGVLPEIVAADDRVVLVMVGAEAVESLQARYAGEEARIRSETARVGMTDHVLMLGKCDDEVLAAAYAGADAHVFPVLDLAGDVEGFGMVALEAAAHGLPTIAYAVGGVPDAVREGKSGWLIASTDVSAFREAVLNALNPAVSEAMFDSCRAFAAEKAWPQFGRRIAKLMQLDDV